MTSLLFKRFFVFRNYLFLAIIGILVLTFFAKQYEFFAFDLYITQTIQLINIPFFAELMLALSWLGNVYQTIISIAVAAAVFAFYRRRDLALGVLFSALGAVVISETLKVIVQRPRPDQNLIHQIEQFTRNDSFPSGHVLFYMGFYGFLLFAAFTFIKGKELRNMISGLLIILIGLIGTSRIYLGSHWFSDTLASYLIGSIWLYIVVLLFKRYQLLLGNVK